MYVRPKKSLGQHFLHDRNIAAKIVNSLRAEGYRTVIEVGPGLGVLTGYLLERKDLEIIPVEIDREAVEFLKETYPVLCGRIVEGDFLKTDFSVLTEGPFGVIGNFPYHISSPIFFRILENRQLVKEVVCMVQKEVAERICSAPGNKTYGILSVLLGAFFRVEYLFTVGEKVFSPPPKVKSAVIRLTRHREGRLPCQEELFFRLVKAGFNQRRKTLRNALKAMLLPTPDHHPLLEKRAEQLNGDDFIALTRWAELYMR